MKQLLRCITNFRSGVKSVDFVMSAVCPLAAISDVRCSIRNLFAPSHRAARNLNTETDPAKTAPASGLISKQKPPGVLTRRVALFRATLRFAQSASGLGRTWM